MSRRYRELAPGPALVERVECLWISCARPDPGALHRHRVLPDGCMDFLVDLRSGTVDVVGTMTVAREVEARGDADLVGVRFHPGEAPAFLGGVPARELVDARLPVTSVEPRLGRALEEGVHRAAGNGVRAGADPSERARDVAASVREILRRTLRRADAVRPSAVTRAALARLAGGHDTRNPGPEPPRVGRVARDLGVSRRHLEREARATVGISPGRFARSCRVRRAGHLLRTHPDWPLARVAHAAGYLDQPHLTREFGSLAGVTPAVYRSART